MLACLSSLSKTALELKCLRFLPDRLPENILSLRRFSDALAAIRASSIIEFSSSLKSELYNFLNELSKAKQRAIAH